MTGFELLPGLPWKVIGEVLAAIGGLGLLAFAGAQVWLQRREQFNRQRAAFGVVNAEFWRLNAKALSWRGEDLLGAARNGALPDDDIAPRDWGVVMQSLGELGPETAALGAFANALLHEVISNVRVLAITGGAGTPAVPGPDLQANAKAALANALATLDDAMRCAPRRVQEVRFTLADPKSDAGKRLKEQYDAKQRAAGAPTGFWATRTGRVLSWIGHFHP